MVLVYLLILLCDCQRAERKKFSFVIKNDEKIHVQSTDIFL